MARGVGHFYAYTALPNVDDVLHQDWVSSEVNGTNLWCASSFARPTVVNGRAYVPHVRR